MIVGFSLENLFGLLLGFLLCGECSIDDGRGLTLFPLVAVDGGGGVSTCTSLRAPIRGCMHACMHSLPDTV